jgi:Flp pilus assembly protein TadD
MKGSLVPSGLAEILRDLFLKESSGVLALSRTEVRKRVHFDRGMIFFADSSLEDEGLIDFLVHEKCLEMSAAAQIPGGRGDDLSLARRLREGGPLSSENLQKTVRQLIQQVVVSTFRWDSGEYSFQETPPGGAESFPSDVLITFEFIMRGIRSMTGFAPIREAMLRLDRGLKMSADLYFPLDRLTLHPIQGFALSRVDGSTRIREIASLIPPSEEDAALRFLFGLLLLGVIETKPPLSAGPLAVRDLLSGDREHAERFERESAVIKEMGREISSGGPWKILGISPGSTHEALRKAFETRKEAFRPERFAKKVQEAYREELVLIESKLLEAYLALTQEFVREATQGGAGGELKLDIETLSKRKELTKTQTQELLEEQVRRAERFYLKARDYFKAKDFYNVIQYCEQALKGNDSDARFHFLLGLALVRNPDYKWQKRAEQSLLRAAQLDPWNAEHFVQLGNFYRNHNLLRKAKKNFQRAAEVMPSNSEANQALSEMKHVES